MFIEQGAIHGNVAPCLIQTVKREQFPACIFTNRRFWLERINEFHLVLLHVWYHIVLGHLKELGWVAGLVLVFSSTRKRHVASFFIFDFTKGFHLFSLLKPSNGRHLKTLLCLAELGRNGFHRPVCPCKRGTGFSLARPCWNPSVLIRDYFARVENNYCAYKVEMTKNCLINADSL